MEETLDIKKIECIIEALLFAYGDKVTLDTISNVIDVDKKTTKMILSNMIYSYNRSSRGLMIREITDGYQLCSRQEYHDFVKKAFEPKMKQSISQAAMETLAIIAYNGPVTKARIEQIRGVNSDSAVARLLERNLVREAGRLETPGRPAIFEVTEEFYRSFGFSSKSDLPILEFQDLARQSEGQEITFDDSSNQSDDQVLN